MDPTVVTPQSFNFFVLFLHAAWVVKLVMLGLAVASLWSWTVILDKTFRFHNLNREADQVEDAVASGRSLEEVAAEAGERPAHALPRMLQGALREWRDARTKGMGTDTQVAFLIRRLLPTAGLPTADAADALAVAIAHAHARKSRRLGQAA